MSESSTKMTAETRDEILAAIDANSRQNGMAAPRGNDGPALYFVQNMGTGKYIAARAGRLVTANRRRRRKVAA